MSDVIKVDIWSDIACPWCYIGKRKFEAGVAAFGGDVEVEYHSFELAPDTPVDFAGSEVDFLVKHKGMSAAQVKPMLDRVAGIAAEVGLDYDFDALQHTKTVKAHQLLHYAKQHGSRSRPRNGCCGPTSSRAAMSAARRISRTWPPRSDSTARTCCGR